MSVVVASAMPHLIAAPILLPLLSAALMLVVSGRRRSWLAGLNILTCLIGLAVSVGLLAWVAARDAPLAFGVYLPSNWPVPFGIVLVLDRLSALMLVLTAVVALPSLLFALARWERAGVRFHPLFQIQLMGLNGAFLTGDLFNLFVFFEVMLVASYGLLLHGSGRARVQASLHYIAVNLFASSLLLVGTAMLYGITGTLNLADMAAKLAQIPATDRGLLHTGVALLGVAFLAKAAVWPLNFWLVPAYAAASAPVAALFAVMTKVGFYAVVRVWTLFFPAAGSDHFFFGANAFVLLGLVTLAFGSIGVMASQRLERLVGFSLIVSTGTLFAAVGFGMPALSAGALYYLLGSTLTASAFYLLLELVERARLGGDEAALAHNPDEGAPFVVGPPVLVTSPAGDVNLDDAEQPLIGRAIPAAMVFLGLGFVVCALLTAGLPPLSTFVAKLVMLIAVLDPSGLGNESRSPSIGAWSLATLLIASGLASTIALVRLGVRYFWAPQARPTPRLRIAECMPIVLLLSACAALMVGAGPALRFTQAAADSLHRPALYIEAVLSARPVPAPAARAALP